MKRVIIAGCAVMLYTNLSLAGGVTSNATTEITLSSAIPVVNQELEIRLNAPPAGVTEASLSILHDGKSVTNETLKLADGKITKKWIPDQTGFYTAAFRFQAGSQEINARLDFPVVWRDLYFFCWHTNASSRRCLSSLVCCKEEDIPYWKSRGSKTLAFISFGGAKIDMEHDEQEVVDRTVMKWSAPLRKGYDGIFIDEFGSYPLPEQLKMLERAGKVLIKLRKENPDMLIVPAAGGALLREEAIYFKYSGSVALLESYDTCLEHAFGTHSFRQHLDHRIMVARNTDLIYQRGRKHAAVILLGVGCDGGGMLIPQLEDQVRYVKRIAPEMPGIGFYTGSASGQWAEDSGLMDAAEEMCMRYYIKPVVDVRELWLSDYSPRVGEAVEVLARVHNSGGMDAKEVKLRIHVFEADRSVKTPSGDEITIPELGTGYVSIAGKFKNQQEAVAAGERKKYEYQNIAGNVYPIFTAYKENLIPRDRHVVKTTWTPKSEGMHTVVVEVIPSEGYTTLDASARLEVYVGAKK